LKSRSAYILILLLMVLSFLGAYQSESKNTAAALSPVEVVVKHYIAKKTNDRNAWLSTMTEEKKEFLDSKHLDYGLIKLEINEIYELSGEELENRINRILDSEKAKELNLSADNISIVNVKFTAEYDNTKVSDSSGTMEWTYKLIRDNNDSPWLIQAWGVGRGGI